MDAIVREAKDQVSEKWASYDYEPDRREEKLKRVCRQASDICSDYHGAGRWPSYDTDRQKEKLKRVCRQASNICLAAERWPAYEHDTDIRKEELKRVCRQALDICSDDHADYDGDIYGDYYYGD